MDYGPCGWVRDDDVVAAVCVAIEAGEFGEKRPAVFGAARPSLKGYWDRITQRGVTGIFLADAELKLFNSHLPPEDQKRGTCVSRGTKRAVQDSWFNSLVMKHSVGIPVELCFEPIYGFARVEIGKGRLGLAVNNPNNDGAVGAWAAAGVERLGVMERKVIGKYDLTVPREDLAILFGDQGVPPEIEAECAGHKVVSHFCPTVKDIADALAAHFGVAICLPRLFGPRDKDGISLMAGNGNHCTELSGVFITKHGDLAFTQQQSWGPNNPKGPDILNYKGGSRRLRPGEFGCMAEEIEPYLKRGGEAWAFEIIDSQGWRQK